MRSCHIANFSHSDLCGDLNAWGCDSPRRVWWLQQISGTSSEVSAQNCVAPRPPVRDLRLKAKKDYSPWGLAVDGQVVTKWLGGGNKKKSTLPHAIYGKPCTYWHKQHAPAFCCTCGWSRSWVPHAWNSLLLFSATLREKDCFPAMPAAWRAMLLWVCIGLPVQARGAAVVSDGGALTQVRSPFEINCDLDGLFSVCIQNRLAK